MGDELLMDLADCGSPEKLLAVILKHHPAWTAPVPVEDFARTVNIVEFRELEGDSFEGALLTEANKQRGVILYGRALGPSAGGSRSRMNSVIS